MDANYFEIAMGFVTQYGPTALAIIGGFAVIARFTPNKVDDRIAQLLADVINFLAMNNGKAKNADEAE